MSNSKAELLAPRKWEGEIEIGSQTFAFHQVEMGTSPAEKYGLFDFEEDLKQVPKAELDEWARCYAEEPVPSAAAIEARGVQARESAKLEILKKVCLFADNARRPTAEEWDSLRFSVRDALLKKQRELNRVSDVLGESRDLRAWVDAQVLPTPSPMESLDPVELPSSEPSGSAHLVTS